MATPSASHPYPGFGVETDPDHSALIIAETGAQMTYGELDIASRRLAHLLRSRGLRRGDQVVLIIENSFAFHIACWACQRSGLYYTPINTRLTAAEADYIISDCGAKAQVVSSSFQTLARALLTGAGMLLKASVHGDIQGYDRLEALIAQQSDGLLDVDQGEGASMLYSSGTTGRPKGIKRPLTDGAPGGPDVFLSLLSRVYGFDSKTVYLCPTPTYHGAGLWYSMAMHRLGATCVVMEKFTSEGFLSAVERYAVSHTQVVPTMFVRLLKLPLSRRTANDLSSLKVVIHAAAPCPVSVKEQMVDWLGPIIHEYFAATEGNGYTHIDTPAWVAHKGSVGRPLLGDIHIVAEDGDELPNGEPGLVYFGGVPAFTYHNDDEKTLGSRHSSGWTTTGDIGKLDNDGFLYLTDRKAFTIISGGVNIYPQEVENLLISHPAVGDAAVFGVPDPDMGEQVKAVIELVDANQASAETEKLLIEFCRERLAHFKCPRSVDFRAELPRGENGKLYKRELRDPYWPQA